MSYRPDIDGLRAVAVLSVLFYHAHLGFPGGYVGVDVFFVISGFLITSLLLKSISKGTFSYVEFWERRVRRLIPALAIVTLFTAVTSAIILLPEDLEDLGGALIAQPLLMSNVYFWRVVEGGYFGDPPETRPLLHTWSLGVEEQFYVVFPILLMVILRRPTLARNLGRILFGLTLFSLGLSVALTPSKGVLSFFTLPTRAWELFLGGLLAVQFYQRGSGSPLPRILRELAALLGLALVGYSIAFYRHDTPFPGYAAMAPCFGTALLIWANSCDDLSLVGKLFSTPAMVRVGQISYSLYLWHWPIIAYGDYLGLLSTTEARVAVILLSCWLGYLSWRWIETPFRAKHWLESRKAITVLFVTYALSCGGLGCLYVGTEGFRHTWFAERGNIIYLDDSKYRIKTDPRSASPQSLALGNGANSELDFILFGDSHAMALGHVFDKLAHERDARGLQMTYNSITPFLASGGDVSSSRKTGHRLTELVIKTASERKVKAVFIVSLWSNRLDSSFEEDLKKTVREFHKRAPRTKICLILDVPTQDGNKAHVQASRRRLGLPEVKPSTEALHRSRNRAVEAVIRRNKGYEILDPSPYFLNIVSLIENEQLLYYDTNHLTEYGSERLAPLLTPWFQRFSRDLVEKTPLGG